MRVERDRKKAHQWQQEQSIPPLFSHRFFVLRQVRSRRGEEGLSGVREDEETRTDSEIIENENQDGGGRVGKGKRRRKRKKITSKQQRYISNKEVDDFDTT